MADDDIITPKDVFKLLAYFRLQLIQEEDDAQALQAGRDLLKKALDATETRISQLKHWELQKAEATDKAIEALKAGGFNEMQIDAVKHLLQTNRRESTQSANRKRKLPDKYFNPDNPTETWSGRGAKPAWILPFRISPWDEKPLVFDEQVHIKNHPTLGAP